MENEQSIKQELKKLEELLLQSEIRKSQVHLSTILSEDFIEFGQSGTVFTKRQIIEALQDEDKIQMVIDDFKIKELGQNIILATYLVTKINESENSKNYSLRSSIWKTIDSKWQMVFHQGTPTGPKT